MSVRERIGRRWLHASGAVVLGLVLTGLTPQAASAEPDRPSQPGVAADADVVATFDTSRTIRISMDVFSYVVGAHTADSWSPLLVDGYAAKTDTGQQWNLSTDTYSDGSLWYRMYRNVATGLCLDGDSSLAYGSGWLVQLKPCDWNKYSQWWAMAAYDRLGHFPAECYPVPPFGGVPPFYCTRWTYTLVPWSNIYSALTFSDGLITQTPRFNTANQWIETWEFPPPIR